MITLSPTAPQRHESLTVYPLLSPDGGGLGCVLLPDAIRAGTLRITEVGQGSVPELVAINTGITDVLILDGEQLIGAKQNRMASRSIGGFSRESNSIAAYVSRSRSATVACFRGPALPRATPTGESMAHSARLSR